VSVIRGLTVVVLKKNTGIMNEPLLQTFTERDTLLYFIGSLAGGVFYFLAEILHGNECS
jgi:hypothetical protein